MEPNFWEERWQRNEIGFHQDAVNPYLQQYWSTLGIAAPATVFVPLCGKSRDMIWLRDQGYRVLGVELSALAVADFFRENHLTPQPSEAADFAQFDAGNIRVRCGDFFRLQPTDLADVTAVYDRAALIALPPVMRARYAAHLLALLRPGTRILLVTLDYPQAEMPGPPFAVAPTEVTELFGAHARIEALAQADVLSHNPRFQARGITRLSERVYLITRTDTPL